MQSDGPSFEVPFPVHGSTLEAVCSVTSRGIDRSALWRNCSDRIETKASSVRYGVVWTGADYTQWHLDSDGASDMAINTTKYLLKLPKSAFPYEQSLRRGHDDRVVFQIKSVQTTKSKKKTLSHLSTVLGHNEQTTSFYAA